MIAKSLSTTFITLTMSLLLIQLFSIPAPADTRVSNLNGGWQIWIDTADVSSRAEKAAMKLGAEEPLTQKAKPWLGKDVIIGLDEKVAGAYMEYDFESPQDGDAYIYCRVMDYRGGGQSWFIVLNSENHEGDGMVIDTTVGWEWKTGRNGPKSPTKLKKGKNTARVVQREAVAGRETLMDIIMVSTVDFVPKDDDFKNATPVTAVQQEGKLATTWGTLKNGF